MSPERPSSRRAPSTPTPKPYVRTTSTKNRDSEESSTSAQLDISQVNNIASRAGFPSYAQYRHIETTYLNGIIPKRQCRALITQAMFDRIWHVLQNPNSLVEDAQFRFWVRKMFTLAKLKDLVVDTDVLNRQTSQVVLLHDGLIVAIKEQIYDILCYAHGITKHGGRDKTFTSVRKHYSWVPKEIVAQFTKACPSCLMKKCGLSKDIQINSTTGVGGEEDSTLPTLRDFLHNLAGKGAISGHGESGWQPSTSIPSIPGPSRSTPINDERSKAADHDEQGTISSPIHGSSHSTATTNDRNFLDCQSNRSEPYEILVNLQKTSEPLRRTKTGLESLPMSREVSLYQGLPNGWQFHTDYATAHAAFTKSKEDPALGNPTIRENRPRIPSIAPMREMPNDISESIIFGGTLPPLRTCNWDQQRGAPPFEMLPSDLHHLRGPPPAMPLPRDTYVPAIDPVLLSLDPFGGFSPPSNCPGSSSSGQDSPREAATPNAPGSSLAGSFPTYSLNPSSRSVASIRRAAAPPSINLESLSSQKTIDAFLAHRATAGISPDTSAPLTYPTESPPSSAGSCSSRLSAFPMTATSSISPANSILPTPVDEIASYGRDSLGKDLANTAGGMNLSVSVEAVCDGAV
jgi:hypothetical protein